MNNKIKLGNIAVNTVNKDFGESLGLLDLIFGSGKKEFTKAENISAARAWLNSIYNDLRPNASYSTFMEALMLDSYNSKISDADFQAFLDTIGYSINNMPSLGDKVKSSLIKAFSSNKNMLPNRRDIVSAMLSPDNIKWTYWDAVKVTASQAATTASDVAKGAASVVTGGASVIGFIVKYRTPIILAALAGVGYFLYRNKDLVSKRLTEKGLKSLGLSK